MQSHGEAESSSLDSSSPVSKSQAIYDPVSPEAHLDPYPIYQQLREHHPLYYVAEHDVWALSRYTDVQEGLRNWEAFSSAEGVELGTYVKFFGPGSIQELDPPRHDVLRKVLAPRFLNKAVKSYEPMVEATAAELLEHLPKHANVDLGLAFTQRLPIMTIFRILGIPEADIAWTTDTGLEMLNRPPGESGPSPQAYELRAELVSFLEAQVDQRRGGDYTDDVFGDLARAIDDGSMEHEEIQGLTLLLIAAGMETTTSLLGTMVHSLATGAVTREELGDGVDLPTAAAIDEFVRFDAPAQWLARVTTKPVSLHGVELETGSRVLMIFASANRDPQVFDRPDELILDRDGSRNLAFGEGIHFCIGMPLAKLEARVGMRQLLRTLPAFKLDGEPTRYPSHVIRGYQSVPIRWAS